MPESVATGASTDLPAPTGNRPAQDARQVHAPNQIDGDWHGGDDATDFLGLDLEVAAPTAIPTTALASKETAPDAAALPAHDSASNSWLLSLDEAKAAQRDLDSIGHVATEDELEPVAADQAEIDPDALDEDPTPAQGALTDASWPERKAPRRGGRKGLLVTVSAAVVAAAAFGAYQFKLRSEVVPDAPLVAHAPVSGHKQPVRPPNDPSDAHGGATKPPVSTSTDAHTKPVTDDVALSTDHSASDGHASTGTDATAHGDSDLVAASGSAPSGGATSSQPDGAATDDRIDPSHARDTRLASGRIDSWLRAQRGGPDADSNPDSSTPFSGTTSSGANTGEPNYGMSRAPYANPGAPSGGVEIPSSTSLRLRPAVKGSASSKGGLRRATADDLAGMWEGSVIPMDAIPGPSRLLTPGVGRVRVLIQQGEIFEGRLYAVGQGLIWLDTDVGRLALLSQQVQRIEHLSAPSGAALGSPGSQELAGLPRVRVRTPGGTFYGKAIARDDTTVTLITDEGARVMLESRDVESAPVGVRSVVIKPAAKR